MLFGLNFEWDKLRFDLSNDPPFAPDFVLHLATEAAVFGGEESQDGQSRIASMRLSHLRRIGPVNLVLNDGSLAPSDIGLQAGDPSDCA
jgi:hypothetical protein